MEFKYSLSMLFSNLGYAFKILVWIIICLLLTFALGAAIIPPIWENIAASTDISVHMDSIRVILRGVWDGSSSIRGALAQGIVECKGVLLAIGENAGVAVGLAFAGVFLYAFYCFIYGLSYYAIADIINNIMASNLKFGFASNMALNFKKCVRYSFSRLLITLPIDLVVLTIVSSILFGLFEHIGFFVLPILLVLGVGCLSMRATLLAGWLPRLLFHPEERTFTAFSRSLTYVKSNAWGLLKSYAITFSLVYLFTTTFAVPTGGLISLVLPAMYYFILRAIELIGYYKTKGYSFYTDGTNVVKTIEYGFRDEQQDKSDDIQEEE